DNLAEWAGVDGETDVEEVVARVYERLAEAPCDALAASLDDVAVVEERPNMPGTIDAWPNWRLALPDLETLERSPLADRVARALNSRRSIE
ncbi:MAG: hypothetical protein J2P57_25140, partial [Acidimicrobiaceae bacterium]|nr:hypothetical protein [Acidimicrobiaceae bacterium]